jgi:hypothetical protein
MKKLLPVIASVCLLGGLGACTRNLDMEKLEGKIKDTIEDQTAAKVDEVECPEKRPIKDDDEFACDVEFEGGGDGTVNVKQKGGGDVKYKLEPILVMSKMEKIVEKGLKEKGLEGDVTGKGDAVRSAEKGDTYKCKADTPGGEKKVTIEVTGKDGKPLEYKSVYEQACSDILDQVNGRACGIPKPVGDRPTHEPFISKKEGKR